MEGSISELNSSFFNVGSQYIMLKVIKLNKKIYSNAYNLVLWRQAHKSYTKEAFMSGHL